VGGLGWLSRHGLPPRWPPLLPAAPVRMGWTAPSWCDKPNPAAKRKSVHLRVGNEPPVVVHISEKAFYTVGRLGQDVVLKGETTSRLHAVILHNAAGETFLLDLKSQNGTYLQDNRLEPWQEYPWRDGGEAQFGIAASRKSCDFAVVVPRDTPPSRGLKRPHEEAVDLPLSRVSTALSRIMTPASSSSSSRSAAAAASATASGSSSSGGAGRSGGPAVAGDRGGAAAVQPAAAAAGRESSSSQLLPASAPQQATRQEPSTQMRPAGSCMPAHSTARGSSGGSAAADVSGGACNAAATCGSSAAASGGGSRGRSRDPAAVRTVGGATTDASGGAATAADSGSSATAAGGGGGGSREAAAVSSREQGCPPNGTHKTMIGPQLPPGASSKQASAPPQGRAAIVAPRPPQRAASAPVAERHRDTAPSSKKCDKCDGPHPTASCPHFRKPREEHKDAWANYGKKHALQMGSQGGNFVLRNAKLIKQPADGSCLFHSLNFGLCREGGGQRSSPYGGAEALRRELARFIAEHPQLEISGDTLEEWVRWDANTSCIGYAKRMSVGGWGGGIEMAACSLLKKVNVHVYEQTRWGEYQRISCFDNPEARKTVHVLYQGGVHYDALVRCR